jgi:hypothetical protein
MIENPQPAWLPLLLLALPGIAFAACSLNAAIFPVRDRPLCTIPAIGMVLALLPTHILASVTGSLSIGLAVAWTVIGLAGYAWIGSRPHAVHSLFSSEHPGLSHRLIIAALATLPIILPTILLNFHDETYFNQHHAIIAHLQNGAYPPRYLYEPSLLLRYHYGFDLAAAIVTGLLRIRVDQAIDVLTLTLWPLMFLLLWRLGEHFGSARAGLFVSLMVCFAGGWPALARIGSTCPRCAANGLEVNPPFISYYFQHPWSIGVPIFCLVVLQRASLPSARNKFLGIVALVLSLAMLSLSQAVLFVTTVAALGLAELWNLARYRHGQAMMLVGLGMSLFIARWLGGFFLAEWFPPVDAQFSFGLQLRDFAAPGAILGQIQWDLASFGALLILGSVGLVRVRRDRAFLAMLTALAFVIVNLLRYKYTWDIVKFGTVSFIALAIAAGVALSDLWGWANNWVRKTGCALLIAALLLQGFLYPFAQLSAYNPESRTRLSVQMIRPYFSVTYSVDPDNARAISFLRTHMGASEIAYRTIEKSEAYAIWGGLPTQASVYPADSGNNDQYGLGEEKFAARVRLAEITENWLDRLTAEHISWLVTDSDDVEINALLDRTETKARVTLARQFGNVRVFRMAAAANHPSLPRPGGNREDSGSIAR